MADIPQFALDEPIVPITSSQPQFHDSEPIIPLSGAKSELPPEPEDHGLSERQKLSPLGKALSPITSYFPTQKRMAEEGLEQASRGIDQLKTGFSNAKEGTLNGMWDAAKGVANTALGGMNYVGSPISAAYRSVAGQPIEDTTGIPREWTETALQLATPGIGFTGAKKIPEANLARAGFKTTPPLPPSAGNDIVEAADRASKVSPNPINVPRAFASDNVAVQRAGQLARNVPFIGDSIPRATGEMADQMGDTVNSIAGHYGEGSGPNVANRIGNALSGASEVEKTASTEAAQNSDHAVLADWQRAQDDALHQVGQHENNALEQARQSTGTMSPQDMGQALIDRLRTEEQVARARKDELYNTAGNSDASVRADSVQAVHGQVSDALNEAGRVIDPVLTPASNAMMNELQNFSNLQIPNRVGPRPPNPTDIAAVDARGMEQTRKRLGAMAQAATNDADRAASGIIMRQFDQWQGHAYDNALFSGSPEALQSFRDARAANASWRQRFYNDRDDADRLINRVVTGEVTPQEMSNWLVGNSQVGSKGVSSRLLTRIEQATNNDQGAMDAIRGGVAHRLFGTAEGATARAPEKIASDIHEFFNGSGRDVANRLFSPEQRRAAIDYANALRRGQEARQDIASVARNTKPTSAPIGPGPMQKLASATLGKSGKSDEALFNAIDSYARSGGRADVQTLADIVRHIPEKDKGDLAGAIIRKLGQSDQAKGFSPEKFATEWAKYTPQAKSILFGNAGAHRQALDDIATIAQRYKEVGRRFGNPSGTGQTVLGFGELAALYTHPFTAIPALIGGAIFARMLFAPASAVATATMLKSSLAMAKMPNPLRLANLSSAAVNFAKAAQNAGSNLSVPQFMHRIAGPSGPGTSDAKERAKGGKVNPVPESKETLLAQQKQMLDGNRDAQLYPSGKDELALPKGLYRAKMPNGDVFHYHPKRMNVKRLQAASKAGKENEVLGLGPHSKIEVMSRAKAGEHPVAIVERDPSGTEVRAAAGTHKTAPTQYATMQANKSNGHTVALERPDHTIARRASGGQIRGFADGGAPDADDVNNADTSVNPIPRHVDQLNLPEIPETALSKYADVPFSSGTKIGNKLTGSGGEERYQTWPERMIRSGASLAGDVMSGKQEMLPPGLRREDYTDKPKPDGLTVAAQPNDEAYERAQDMAGMAGVGGVGGTGAEAGAALGSSPILRPALKYQGKIYKAPPGGEHADAMSPELYKEYQKYQKQALSGEDMSNFDFGFMNHKGQFLDRDAAMDYAVKEGMIDPQAVKQGALTSTILSDSSEPGAALSALEHQQRTPEMEIAKSAPNNLPQIYKPLAEAKPEISKSIQDFVNLSRDMEKKYNTSDWVSKLTPEDVEKIKADPKYMDATSKMNGAALEGAFTNVLNQPMTRRSFLTNTAAAARLVASSGKLGKMLETVAPKEPVSTTSIATSTGRASSAFSYLTDLYSRDLDDVDPTNVFKKYGLTKEDVPELKTELKGAATADGWRKSELRDIRSAIKELEGTKILTEEQRLQREWKQAKRNYESLQRENLDSNGMYIHGESPLASIPLQEAYKKYSNALDRSLSYSKPLLSDSSTTGAPLAALEHAPPFYSAVEKTIQSASQQKMHGEQWANWLKNQPGVKPDELQYTGVDKWLREQNGPVTKQQVADFIDKNKVQVNDVVKGNVDTSIDKLPKAKLRDLMHDYAETNDIPVQKVDKDYTDGRNWEQLQEHYDSMREAYPDEYLAHTKYHGYQLPGGENYREHLLTLPKKDFGKFTQAESDELQGLLAKDEKTYAGGPKLTPEEESRYNELYVQHRERARLSDEENQKPKYKSSHWDEPNILAHVRTNDRDVGGVPALHLEELQSDWSAQGEKQGFNKSVQQTRDDLISEQRDLQVKIKALEDKYGGWKEASGKENYDDLIHRIESVDLAIEDGIDPLTAHRAPDERRPLQGVPDMPFKGSKKWVDLAMKRMIQKAATEGKSRISWTPGEAQAARYDLSKHISTIEYSPDTQYLRAYKEGNVVLNQKATPEELPNIIGKEASDKILNSPTKQLKGANHPPGWGKNDYDKDGSTHVLEGLDLKVGGEGMKGFYDQMLPKMVEKLGKQYGVKVKRTNNASLVTPEARNEVDSILKNAGWNNVNHKNLGPYQIPGLQRAYLKDEISAEDYAKLKTFYDQKQKEDWNTTPAGTWYFDIPPKMKEDVLKKGFPLFSDTTHGGVLNQNTKKDKQDVERPEQESKTEPEINVPQRASGGRVEASNIDKFPSEKMKHAGNYSKDHLHVHGLDLVLEHAKGHRRNGIGPEGPWEVKMPSHYGYIRRAPFGADKAHIDIYLGPHIKSDKVFVVNQVDKDTMKWDEHKVLLGFRNLQHALETYCKAFSDSKGHERIGSIVPTDIKQFKQWLQNGDTKKPFVSKLN